MDNFKLCTKAFVTFGYTLCGHFVPIENWIKKLSRKVFVTFVSQP